MTDPITPPLNGAQKAWAGFAVSLILATLTALVVPLSSGDFGPSAWISVGLAVVTAIGTGLGVYQVTNRPV
jgi:VIT1/CCC1 family predicted Fe2+/Mn2+ transporter